MFELTPEATIVLTFVLFWIGSLTRMFFPYVLKRVEDGAKFDWRYLIGQALTSGGVFVLALLSQEFVESIGSLGLFGGLLAGFGAASIGRNGQKTVDVARGK